MFTLLALGLAAPVPKAKPAPTYFPTAVGTKWVYRQDNKREWTDEIVSAESKDGELRVVIRETEDGHHSDTIFTVTPAGVTKKSSGRWQCGWQILKYPLKEGDAWEVTTPVQMGYVCESGKMTVGKLEDVTVPAGKFKAFKIEFEASADAGVPLPKPKWRYNWWYAEGVGVVQFTAADTDRVLKSFTPAKPAGGK